MTTDTIKITRRAAFLTQDQEVVLPRKLTAENGAKKLLIWEFFETRTISCPDCEIYNDLDGCDFCQNTGYVVEKIPVSWTTIKAIHDKIVESLEVKP